VIQRMERLWLPLQGLDQTPCTRLRISNRFVQDEPMFTQRACDRVVALTLSDISQGVGTCWVAPPPSTLDATPVLGGFRC